MKRTGTLVLAAFLVLVVTAISGCVPASPVDSAKVPAPTQTACGAWNIVSSSLAGGTRGDTSLEDVAVISADDAWAVGTQFSLVPDRSRTLIEHWNGRSWSLTDSPDSGSSNNSLFGIAAISTSDIWAVGQYETRPGLFQTLLEHWNGQRWSVVASPNVDHFNTLSGVIALSSTNVWAVGASSSAPNQEEQTLIMHYDGSQWKVVASPNVKASSNHLGGITAISAHDVWAVGQYGDSDKGAGETKTLVEHWNGSRWSIVASPNIPATNNGLESVSGTSAYDIWAVGSTFDFASATGQPLIEHFNGSTWSIVQSPQSETVSRLMGVTALSSHLIWAVGSSSQDGDPDHEKTLIEQWNGSRWSIVASPNVDVTGNTLTKVAHDAKNGATWAVGATGSKPSQTLTEVFC